jgi:aconitate hydratase
VPDEDGSEVQILVSETSDRLQLLAPFEAWDAYYRSKVIIKELLVSVTTDHIS